MGTLLDAPTRQALVNSVALHEGFRSRVYRDTVGVWTIGYGRNVEDKGISKSEAAFLLQNDLDEAEAACRRGFPWFTDLSPGRQMVLIEMAFNMGFTRLLGFGKALGFAKAGEHDKAADHFLDSRWAQQVGQRAVTLAERYRVG